MEKIYSQQICGEADSFLVDFLQSAVFWSFVWNVGNVATSPKLIPISFSLPLSLLSLCFSQWAQSSAVWSWTCKHLPHSSNCSNSSRFSLSPCKLLVRHNSLDCSDCVWTRSHVSSCLSSSWQHLATHSWHVTSNSTISSSSSRSSSNIAASNHRV